MPPANIIGQIVSTLRRQEDMNGYEEEKRRREHSSGNASHMLPNVCRDGHHQPSLFSYGLGFCKGATGTIYMHYSPISSAQKQIFLPLFQYGVLFSPHTHRLPIPFTFHLQCTCRHPLAQFCRRSRVWESWDRCCHVAGCLTNICACTVHSLTRAVSL